jgi:hypothetical protein
MTHAIDLEHLASQLERVLAEQVRIRAEIGVLRADMGDLRHDVRVIAATLLRIDTTKVAAIALRRRKPASAGAYRFGAPWGGSRASAAGDPGNTPPIAAARGRVEWRAPAYSAPPFLCPDRATWPPGA